MDQNELQTETERVILSIKKSYTKPDFWILDGGYYINAKTNITKHEHNFTPTGGGGGLYHYNGGGEYTSTEIGGFVS